MGIKTNLLRPPPWGSVVHPFLNLHITRVIAETPVEDVCNGPLSLEESLVDEIDHGNDRRTTWLEDELPPSDGAVDIAMTDAPIDHSFTQSEPSDDCESADTSVADDLDHDARLFPLPLVSNIFGQADEVAFPEMESKVLELCRSFGWPDVWIERLDEEFGIFPLAYGINLKSDSACRYTITINTDNHQSAAEQIKGQACLSSFLRGRVHTSEAVAYDCTGNNPTNKPFILESRIPGISVAQIYESVLPIEERRDLVLAMAETVATFQATRFENAGTFEAACTTLASEHDLRLDAVIPLITPFRIYGGIFSKPGPRLDRGTKAWFLSFHSNGIDDHQELLPIALAVAARGCLVSAEDPRRSITSLYNRYVDEHLLGITLHLRLMEIVEEMDQMSFFDPNGLDITISPLDGIDPYMIYFEKINDKWQFSGFRCFYDAEALPQVLTRAPPSWLWEMVDETSNDTSSHRLEDEEMQLGNDTDPCFPDDVVSDSGDTESVFRVDEGESSTIPAASESNGDQSPGLSDDENGLKSTFDERMEQLVPGYCEDAYGSGLWLRRLWDFTKDGISGWRFEDCEDFIQDWEEYVDCDVSTRWSRLSRSERSGPRRPHTESYCR